MGDDSGTLSRRAWVERFARDPSAECQTALSSRVLQWLEGRDGGLERICTEDEFRHDIARQVRVERRTGARRSQRTVGEDQLPVPRTPTHEMTLASHEACQRFFSTLASEVDPTIVVRFFGALDRDLTLVESAAELGETSVTLRVRMHRAKAGIRRAVEALKDHPARRQPPRKKL